MNTEHALSTLYGDNGGLFSTGVVFESPMANLLMLSMAAKGLLAMLLAAATYHDVTRFRIPNAVTYPTLLAALILNACASAVNDVRIGDASWLGPIGLQQSLLGAAAGFGVMAIIFTATGRGAGDVKLAAAIGAIIGPAPVLVTIVWTHMLAGTFAVAWLCWHVGPLQIIAFGSRWLAAAALPQYVLAPTWSASLVLSRPVPLAGFFAAGVLLTLQGVGL